MCSGLRQACFAFGELLESRNAVPPPSNQVSLLLVWPSFLGFLNEGDAPWARRKRAIHGPMRLSRHPCRSAHSTPPAFSLHPSRDVWCLDGCVRRSRSRSRSTAAAAAMANGKWQMANGKWQMANGKWQWRRSVNTGPVADRLAGGSDLPYATAGKPDCYRGCVGSGLRCL